MPPPPPPPLASIPTKSAPKTDRNALLTDIHKGIKLKKTVTNDRSGPIIAGKTNTTTSNSSNNVNNKLNGNTTSSTNIQRPMIPPGIRSNPTDQLNSMFAGGFPKKPSEMKNLLSKPVSSPPVVRPPSPEVKKVNLPPGPPLIKPKPGGYSNSGTLNRNNDSSVTSLKDEGNTNTIKQRPGGPPPPPPPKKFSGQQFGGYSGTTPSQGVPPPPVPPPVFNRPFPPTLPNPPPPLQVSSKTTNDSGAVSPVRPPPPPPQRLQSIPQVSSNHSLQPLNTENTSDHAELNNNSKIERIVEAFYSRFKFTPLHEIPPPPEFKNIPKEYTSNRKKITQH